MPKISSSTLLANPTGAEDKLREKLNNFTGVRGEMQFLFLMNDFHSSCFPFLFQLSSIKLNKPKIPIQNVKTNMKIHSIQTMLVVFALPLLIR
jgi:hypothetical protein